MGLYWQQRCSGLFLQLMTSRSQILGLMLDFFFWDDLGLEVVAAVAVGIEIGPTFSQIGQ